LAASWLHNEDHDMPTFSLPIIGGFLVSMLSQFAGLALIPATRGFTALWPTVGCISAFLIGIGVSARLVHNGVQLSIITPFMTVALQLLVLVVALTVYGETASFAKIALLVCAALMIGAATQL
jgi:hypothetical protein